MRNDFGSLHIRQIKSIMQKRAVRLSRLSVGGPFDRPPYQLSDTERFRYQTPCSQLTQRFPLTVAFNRHGFGLLSLPSSPSLEAQNSGRCR